MRRNAVFSCQGLGDGLLSLVLSHNLTLLNEETITYHPFLNQLQSWFPHLSLQPRFPIENMEEELSRYQRLFFIYEKTGWMQQVMEFALRKYPQHTHILNPIATMNQDYAYWSEGQFKGNIPFAENLKVYCSKKLHINQAVATNGIILPKGVQKQRFEKRIVIHPTSSRKGKNWSQEKFLELSRSLKQEGFDPVFILTEAEKQLWPDTTSPHFSDIGQLAAFIAESKAMIGNDSGIGHLSSCLGLPTLTICRNEKIAQFWRPAWAKNQLVFPSAWIPNFKGMRIRDSHWEKWVSVNRVKQEFFKLI